MARLSFRLATAAELVGKQQPRNEAACAAPRGSLRANGPAWQTGKLAVVGVTLVVHQMNDVAGLFVGNRLQDLRIIVLLEIVWKLAQHAEGRAGPGARS
jgi:hypothetical protein